MIKSFFPAMEKGLMSALHEPPAPLSLAGVVRSITGLKLAGASLLSGPPVLEDIFSSSRFICKHVQLHSPDVYAYF